MNIACLGLAGTYSHEAVEILKTRLVPRGISDEGHLLFCRSLLEVFGLVNKNVLGVVPVENSITGLVSEVVRDCWMESYKNNCNRPQVVDEINLPIVHRLLVPPHIVSFKQLTEIYSHPQALAQCRQKLKKLGVNEKQLVASDSTASAAKTVRDLMFEEFSCVLGAAGAIASGFAAQAYGLKVWGDPLNDSPFNTTRFHVLGTEETGPIGQDKTALIFWLEDQPGVLAEVLDLVSDEGINLSSIHSLPLGEAGKYAFYCEFDLHAGTAIGASVLERIKQRVLATLVLGSFPREVVDK